VKISAEIIRGVDITFLGLHAFNVYELLAFRKEVALEIHLHFDSLQIALIGRRKRLAEHLSVIL